MEAVFRALADDSRRQVLDLLFEREGRTLAELTDHFDMTRFGVMKHLRILEEAGLVASKRAGREKLHYLNPVPIRQIHDRWTSKFAGRAAATLIDLKQTLEEEAASSPPSTPAGTRVSPPTSPRASAGTSSSRATPSSSR